MRSGDSVPSRGRKPARDRAQGSLEGILPPENALVASLDALEESVTLLLDRHATLIDAHAAAEERRLSTDGLDPLELQDRLRALEADKESIERHATFLEDRIRGLLSRVRYVNES